MSLEGFTPFPLRHFGGSADYDDPTLIPPGLAILARNVRFRKTSVRTRDGMQHTMSYAPLVGDVTGLEVLNVLVTNPQQVSIVMTDAGVLLRETPTGSGTLAPVVLPNITLPAGASMISTKAYNRIYMAFSNLVKALAPPLVLDGPTGVVSPVSQNPLAAPWQANHQYFEGDLVTPTGNPKRWFRALLPFRSGDSEPVWPPFDGYFVFAYNFQRAAASEPVVAPFGGLGECWEEWTPTVSQWLPTPEPISDIVNNPGGGTIPIGRDIYVRLAYKNDVGESIWSEPAIFSNTQANDQLTVRFQANEFDYWFSGTLQGSSAGMVLLGGILQAAGADGGQQVTGNLGTVGFHTGPLLTGDLQNGGTFDSAGSNINIVGNGLNGAPVGTVVNAPFTGTIQWAMRLDASGFRTYTLTADITGGGSVTISLTVHGFFAGNEALGQNSGLAAIPSATPVAAFGGPRMPKWFATLIGKGTVGDFHYPNATPLNVYVASVPTTDPEPTLYGLVAGSPFRADQPIVISAIPAQATPVRTFPTGSFTLLPFIGEPGKRNFIVLREDLNDSLSPVDPLGVLAMQISGPAVANILSASRTGGGAATLQVDDVSRIAVGAHINVADVLDTSFNGLYTVTGVTPGGAGVPLPGGTVTYNGVLSAATSSGGLIQVEAQNPTNPAPIAVLPPGNLDFGTSYSFDIVAVAVVGADVAGPFFRITEPDPEIAFSTGVSRITRVADVCTALVDDTSGLSPGNFVNVAGPWINSTSFQGPVVLATVGAGNVTYVQPGVDASTGAIPNGNTSMTVLQELPTQHAPVSPVTNPFIINFDDTFLSESDDVTDQLNAIPAPESVDVYYSPSLNMVVYTRGDDSSHYFSNVNDPGNVQSPGGILGVGQSDGSKTLAFRETINGELLSFKETAGYAITPDAVPPNQWGVSRRWEGHGPCGPRALDIGPDFAIYFDENSGPYRYYNGESVPVGLEKQGTWDRLNKDAKQHVWVVIDDAAKEVRIGLPLDDATLPSHELVLNYFNGWNEPLEQTISGDEVPDTHGRRWSENDRKVRLGKIVRRDLAAAVDQRIDHRQMLYGMINTLATTGINVETVILDATENPQPTLDFGDYFVQVAKVVGGQERAWSRVFGSFNMKNTTIDTPDGTNPAYQVIEVELPQGTDAESWNIYFRNSGGFNWQLVNVDVNTPQFLIVAPGTPSVAPQGTVFVDMTVPDVFNDNGEAIDSRYLPAFMSAETLDVMEWPRLKARMKGNGLISLQPTTDDEAATWKPLAQDLTGGKTVKFSKGFGPIFNELFALEINNGKQPDVWFELQAFVPYGRLKQDARLG